MAALRGIDSTNQLKCYAASIESGVRSSPRACRVVNQPAEIREGLAG